jgi:hypothetical protein
VRIVRYTKEEREHAHRALLAFHEDSRWKAERAKAVGTYFQGLPEDATEREREITTGHLNVQSCCLAFMLADHFTHEGRSLAQHFLESKRAFLLTRGARAWMEEFMFSAAAAYEVLDVVPGRHCRLRELLANEECEVHDHLGTQDLAPGRVLAARVLQRGDGRLGFDGDLLLLPGSAKDLREILQDWFEHEMDLPRTETGFLAFRKVLPPFFLEYWFDGNFRAQAASEPIRVNGEIAEQGTAQFWMPADVSPALVFAGYPNLEPEGDACWHYFTEQEGKRALAGRIFMEPGIPILVLQSYGRTSMKELRDLAKRAFGGRLYHRMTRYNPPLRTESGRGSQLSVERVAVPLDEIDVPPEHPEFQERVRANLMVKHYSDWTRHPVPIFEGRTPAEAAADPAWRNRVLELVVVMEQTERADAEHRGPGAKPFDFRAIRAELGFSILAE